MSKTYHVAVLGAGNMGTAVAQVIAKNGYQVNLWNHAGDVKPLEQIKRCRENKKYLPGIKLSANIKVRLDIKEAVYSVDVVFFVVPSFCIESVVKLVSKHLGAKTICVDMSKGIDEKSLGIIPDIIKKNLPINLRQLITTVSGPAIATDMAIGHFTAMNIGSESKEAIRIVRQVLENDRLKLVATNDIIGIEVTGSFKNVYAIAMGLCDGLGLKMNTKAALLTMALKEISLLVKKMGGKSCTVYDLAGLGDLIGTSLCSKSRNRRFGEYLAKGYSINESSKKIGQVVEGITAAKVLHALGKKYGLKTPFAELVYLVSSGRIKAKQAFDIFLRSF